MSYASYVFAAYGVFVMVLAWDYFATRFRIAQLMRKARLRPARAATRPARTNAGVSP